jgi:hypothetical protein
MLNGRFLKLRNNTYELIVIATSNRTLARLTYLYTLQATYNSSVLMSLFLGADRIISLPRRFPSSLFGR